MSRLTWLPLALLACATTPPPATRRVPPATSAAALPGEIARALDVDGDERPDVYSFYAAAPGGESTGRLLRSESDLDRNGLVDAWAWYGDDGFVVQQDFDLNGDGRPDATSFYERGVEVRREVAR